MSDPRPHAGAIIALLKVKAEDAPQRCYAHAWATTCITVDAYTQGGGRSAHTRYVWRINGVRVGREAVETELSELVALGLANVNDISLTN
ncbi:hypothetical protein [Stutzerimonas stutzeri]|uniref:hypothetical protein n=1 Tax=Stutzerimonas stutzeri TaxID=316 RepID=UPI00265D56DC|nr:hypothetical protein [Stutzerimonas stutzeri]MCF6783385.1 hypothetical protein [Stutzerimonas stutzeri]